MSLFPTLIIGPLSTLAKSLFFHLVTSYLFFLSYNTLNLFKPLLLLAVGSVTVGVRCICTRGSVSWDIWFLFWQHLYNSRQDVEDRVTLSQSDRGRNPLFNKRMAQQQPKPNHNHIKSSTRASSAGDQRDYTTESNRSPTTEDQTMKTGSQSLFRQINLISRKKTRRII